MTISRNTFDAAKSYKRVLFHEDRDLLDSELNELQEISLHDRQVLWDRIFTPGSILSGLAGAVNGTQVIFADGIVYLDGHPVRVPGATLAFPDPGVHTVYVDVFRRETTVADDPDLVNPLTGEPTAEREKWVASLQTRDTSGDPLPEGATGRTVVQVYTFDRDAGTLTPVVAHVVSPDDPGTLDGHIGQGGLDQHPAATANLAGFLTPAEKAKLEAIAPNATRGQRSATLVIAAADTSVAGKASADALCTGQFTLSPKTGDQDTINTAIDVVAALPGGGTIVLLEGTYQITGPIRLKTKVRLAGVGISSRLKVPDGATDAGAFNVIENHDRTAGNSDMAVVDLSIDGRAATNTGTGSHGIAWWAPVRGLIERVSVQSCAGHGILIEGDSGHPIWYTTIRGCAVDSCRGLGIWFDGNGWMNSLTETLVQRNEAEAGVRLSAVGETLLAQNRVYYNHQHGVLLDGGCGRVSVIGNILSHNGISADDTYTNLRVALADRCLIQGNLCRRYMMGGDLDQAKYGLHIAAGLNNFVVGNMLYEGGKTADFLDEGTGTYRHGNVTSAGLQDP